MNRAILILDTSVTTAMKSSAMPLATPLTLSISADVTVATFIAIPTRALCLVPWLNQTTATHVLHHLPVLAVITANSAAGMKQMERVFPTRPVIVVVLPSIAILEAPFRAHLFARRFHL